MHQPRLAYQLPFWVLSLTGIVAMALGIYANESGPFRWGFALSLAILVIEFVPRWSAYLPGPLHFAPMLFLVIGLLGLIAAEFIPSLAYWRVYFQVLVVLSAALQLASHIVGHFRGARSAG